MNEKEKKAIENLNSFKSISILYGNTFTMFLDQLKKYQESTDTVLNLITKLQKENEEKDKQIDLMANSILAREIGKNSCQFNKTCTKFEKGRDIHCKHCIKQYFERKAEDEK